MTRTILITGANNGIWLELTQALLDPHHPDYGPDYWGAPWSGILMMTLVCVVLGGWLAYVTIRSESILPAAIFHGVGNVIGELPVLVSFLSLSPLVGPNPTGIVGMSGLIIGAVKLFTRLPRPE